MDISDLFYQTPTRTSGALRAQIQDCGARVERIRTYPPTAEAVSKVGKESHTRQCVDGFKSFLTADSPDLFLRASRVGFYCGHCVVDRI